MVEIGNLLQSPPRPEPRSTRPTDPSPALSGLGSFHNAALRILAARELDEALGGVTEEARTLLDSDIAGVMLRDGDTIAMRGCVGHHRLETSRLVMGRGQGLAGLVFATGEPARTDDYLQSTTISDDFQSLARLEGTQCALGAPIRLKGVIIGVLEVWRRTAEAYDDVDTGHLVALADLAAIAIDNARLIEANADALVQVERANARLAEQLARVDHALALQHQLLDDLLNRRRVKELVATVAEHSTWAVALLDRDLEVVAVVGDDDPEFLVAAAELARGQQAVREVGFRPTPSALLAVLGVHIGDEPTGWLVVAAPPEVDRSDLTLMLTQATLACALGQLKERTVAEARAAMREDMLLNLLTGSEQDRRAAATRAKHVGIDLRSPLRVCVAGIELPSDRATSLADGAGADTLRRRLLRDIEQQLADARVSRSLSALRGDTAVVLTRSEGPRLRETLDEVVATLARDYPGITVRWGVSAARTSPIQLGDASQEATTALQVAQSSAALRVALFDQLGIIGLVLGGPQGPNLVDFITATIGPLIEHDRERGSELVATLRSWLDCNCSQSETAEALFVHPKTIKYRLGQVSRLTGLDLRTHRDRLRADFAVRTAGLV